VEEPDNQQPSTGTPDYEGEGSPMVTVTDSITVATLERMAVGRFGNLVKAVVDVERGIMVVDADMHADEEALLIDDGSHQRSLWGINLHPGKFGTPEFVEYDSMVNLRPSQGNRSKFVEDPRERERVEKLVSRLVKP
jgi:hypothetical protein